MILNEMCQFRFDNNSRSNTDFYTDKSVCLGSLKVH